MICELQLMITHNVSACLIIKLKNENWFNRTRT